VIPGDFKDYDYQFTQSESGNRLALKRCTNSPTPSNVGTENRPL